MCQSQKSKMEQDFEVPDEIAKKAEKATQNLLPRKSRDSYDKEYDQFLKWMSENAVENINETVLLGYFNDLSEKFSPSSLWAKYSMIKKTLMVNKNINICNFHKLCEYLKQKSKGYEPKKSSVLTRENVLKFIHEAPNETFLMNKVALLFGVFGGCRRQELVNMLVTHVEDRKSVFVVTVPETKTDKKRVFTIIDEDEMKSLKLIRDYISLRPHGCSEKRLFLSYRQGRCTVQPVGKNTFGKIPCIIAKYLGLNNPKKYTGHCLRRTSATLLAEAGANMTTLKRHGGWKSTTVAEGYLEDSISSKNEVSRMLAGIQSGSRISLQKLETQTMNHESTFAAGNLAISGTFQNCQFYVNTTK